MYVISGATGNTGMPITKSLLEAGKKVRIISRSKEKASELIEKGADFFHGDGSDSGLLREAFDGARAFYAMIPPDFSSSDFFEHQKKFADSFSEALKESSVKHTVTLSSIGTHLESDSGVVLGLRYMEKSLNDISGLNTLHLRPGYFMENLLGMARMAKEMNMIASPIRSDLSFPLIATKDIATAAARELVHLDFTGNNIKYLLGPRDITFPEITRILGEAIGKPDLPYAEISHAQLSEAMVKQMGASENIATSFNTFIAAMNDGRIFSDTTRTSENSTETDITEFATTFVEYYKSI